MYNDRLGSNPLLSIMNPHVAYSTSFVALLNSFWVNRQLIYQMVCQNVIGRYRGSVMGLCWSFFNPLFMLVVYTFVFSVVFRVRWGGTSDENRVQFAVLLFVGLIAHSLLAEALINAPALIRNNTNYVKRVIFPLEILPVVSLGAILFHSIISLIVLLVVFFLANGFVHWTAVFIPFVWCPLLLATLGFSWILASLGVFLRDVGQLVGILATVLLFLAPVFYPLERVPEQYHIWIMANPLTFIIQQSRRVLIFGSMPDWLGLFFYLLVSLVVLWVGFWWFQKTRKGFADVL